MVGVAVALGFATRRGGVLSGVVLDDRREDPLAVRSFAAGRLDRGRTVTPHADFRVADPDLLAEAVAATAAMLIGAAREEVGRLLTAAAGEPIVAIGVIVPRGPKVDDLGRRVARRRYAEVADEHLAADAVVAAARESGAPVVAVDGAEALRRSEQYLGLDRRALGEQARSAQPALGADFRYQFRLPTLAARIARAMVRAGQLDRSDSR